MLGRTESSELFQHPIALEPDRSRGYRARLSAAVSEALRHGEKRVVIDCASLKELDLMVLSALLCCAHECAEHGVDFDLLNLRPDVRARIDALQLSRHFERAVSAAN